MKFTAQIATLDKDEYTTVLGFADDAENPQCSVLLQITNCPTDEDIKLGHAGIYLEVNDRRHHGYNLLESIEATVDGVLLRTNREAMTVGIDAELSITLCDGTIDGLPISEALRDFQQRLRIFGERRPDIFVD